ncbi:hypothetical protein QJS10_CPB04g00958 [Acorus calamus]|uniref:Uncharacterized protein n=1 Tax=Acorus calamus TaxID=4465 RepID=A0AAV9F4C7_ACOCL|nr:hypothetical protein QJS10_CPB04g00958 [Acorus calamus]
MGFVSLRTIDTAGSVIWGTVIRGQGVFHIRLAVAQDYNLFNLNLMSLLVDLPGFAFRKPV